MLGKIKDAIQGRLYRNCIEEYERELRCQTEPYLVWVRETEQGSAVSARTAAGNAVGTVCIEQCGRAFSLAAFKQDYILFVSEAGRLSDWAASEIAQYFETHQDVDLVYADEDTWMLPEEQTLSEDESAHRVFPWTKPVWSPDTLLSFLYFGNVFAVRRAAFTGLEWLGDDDYRYNIYDFVLKASEGEHCPAHLEKILFHAYRTGKNRAEIEETLMHETDLIGVGAAYDWIRERAFARRGICAGMAEDAATGITYPIYRVPDTPLVSIVIPSKDNPEVLKQCIRSIYRHTAYPDYEIIVVDNGSAETVRSALLAFGQECPFDYLYQPMDFNFSRMCNLGAKRAKGAYLLLLNDDMEVLESSWLTRMVGQASLRRAF